MITLDRVLWELAQVLTVAPEKGGSPYAYRFYTPDLLAEDGRLVAMRDAPLIEIRAFYDGNYTITPCDLTTRPLGAPVPPERTDSGPMVVGHGGLIQPGTIKQPIPDREPAAPEPEVEPAPEVLELAAEMDVPPPSERPDDPIKRSAWRRFWGID